MMWHFVHIIIFQFIDLDMPNRVRQLGLVNVAWF